MAIAIVDDEQDLVNLFSEALQMSGYEVCTFTNPLLAYEQIKENPMKYSLLITDYRMPQMNGLILASKLSEINKNLAIVMSAYDTVKCNYKLLQKPLKISALIEVVNESITPVSISPKKELNKI
jgi:DNA-binding NtrC family response regulator